MRERVEQLVGNRARAMWVMTFHSACARMLRADADKLGYTRGFTIYDEQDSLRLVKACIDELDVDPKRFAPARHPPPDLGREEPAPRRRGLPPEGLDLLRADGRRRLRPLREAPPRGERDGLRRPAVPLREPVRALRGGPQPLPPLLPPRPGRRVPGHEPRPVPLAAAADGGAPEPLRGRRRRPVPRSPGRRSRWPTAPRSRSRTSRRATRSCRTTAAATCAPRRVLRIHRSTATEGVVITTGRRPAPDQHAGARALRRRVRGRPSGTGHDHALRRRPRRPPGAPGHDRRSPSRVQRLRRSPGAGEPSGGPNLAP